MNAPRIPYVNWYPADFMHGVRGLTAAEVGVYTMLLCRMYEGDGPVEAHETRLAAYCGMRVAPFRNALARLVELDKLQLADGNLSNRRAEVEIASRKRTLQANTAAGVASGKKGKICAAMTQKTKVQNAP